MREEVKIAPIGFKYDFTSKEGGGSYTVTGHINCERCESLCENREWTEPSRRHRQKFFFYSRYIWCWNCGLYKPDLESKVFIK